MCRLSPCYQLRVARRSVRRTKRRRCTDRSRALNKPPLMFFAVLLDSERGQNRTGPCGLDEGAPDEKALAGFGMKRLRTGFLNPIFPHPCAQTRSPPRRLGLRLKEQTIMAGKNVLTLTTTNFENEVANSDLPVLVDFWATWCGPCRAVAPIVEQLAGDFEGRAKIGKIDVDAEGELARKFGISSIPTLMVFKGGEVVEQVLGARPKKQLASLLEKHV